MNAALVRFLLACLLVLPIGCKKGSSANGGFRQGSGNTTQTSGPSTVTTTASAQEQMALKNARAFLDGGGNVNAKDSLGTTRLMDAALNDYGEVADLLVSKGAEVNAVDETLGQTALHYCAIGDNARAAAALIEREANINAKDRRGKTALHEAAAAGSVNLIKLLLNKKADVKVLDGMGKTPIDRAAQAHQEEAVALLLAAGSDPAHKPPVPPRVISKSSSPEAKDKVPVESAPPPGPAVVGIFPAQPFNGMQIEYRLEGVIVDSSKEEEGFTTSRMLTGKVTGKNFRVTGRVGMQSGIRADVRIHLESGAEKKEFPLTITVGDPKTNWREFDLSVPVSSGAAGLVIEMIGSYNVAQRRLLLRAGFSYSGKPVIPELTASPAGKPPANDAALDLWFSRLAWMKQLEAALPRGVSLSVMADPPDAEGWVSVAVRENHAPDSGFDPNVSPMVGIFRVSADRRKIERMEPVSGEYQPLEGFLKKRGLNIAADAPAPPKTASTAPGTLSVTAGDFESTPPKLPDRDSPVIVAESGNPKNHVARITGPDEMGFTLPVTVPAGTQQLAISLRLLHPLSTKLIRFEDGRMPEGIRLRVRLLNDKGNSAIRDMVVRPSGQWRKLEYVFYDLPGKLVQVSVEAIWMNGPVYVDDVGLTNPDKGEPRP